MVVCVLSDPFFPTHTGCDTRVNSGKSPRELSPHFSDQKPFKTQRCIAKPRTKSCGLDERNQTCVNVSMTILLESCIS